MKVYIFQDLEELSINAALLFQEISSRTVSVKGNFTVAISGGSTPRRLYSLLSSDPFLGIINWNHIHIFWTDERCVSIHDQESNFKFVNESLLSRISIPNTNVHRIKGEDGPEKGAKTYEEEIRQFFGASALPDFDLIILGMGVDGHTASLFPFSHSIDEKNRMVIPVYKERNRTDRISLTLPVLNNAHQILFLVSGKQKANTLKMVLNNKAKKQYPAGRIDPVHGILSWFVDLDAARNLKNHSTS
jgi:6-phosphogluconolactonase